MAPTRTGGRGDPSPDRRKTPDLASPVLRRETVLLTEDRSQTFDLPADDVGGGVERGGDVDPSAALPKPRPPPPVARNGVISRRSSVPSPLLGLLHRPSLQLSVESRSSL